MRVIIEHLRIAHGTENRRLVVFNFRAGRIGNSQINDFAAGREGFLVRDA
jgi:hypothetical protein